MDARERYDMMLKQARADGEVKQGPLGIPGWKPISKATRKWMIANGKLPATVDNLKKIGKGKARTIARATVQKVGTSPAIPPGMKKEDLVEIMRRHQEKGMIILK